MSPSSSTKESRKQIQSSSFYSKHTPEAKWQKLEINSAVWNEIEQEGGQCIVLRLDDTDIPPVLGPRFTAR